MLDEIEKSFQKMREQGRSPDVDQLVLKDNSRQTGSIMKMNKNTARAHRPDPIFQYVLNVRHKETP
jgi:NAD-specific glutamate dehydrogenase